MRGSASAGTDGRETVSSWTGGIAGRRRLWRTPCCPPLSHCKRSATSGVGATPAEGRMGDDSSTPPRTPLIAPRCRSAPTCGRLSNVGRLHRATSGKADVAGFPWRGLPTRTGSSFHKSRKDTMPHLLAARPMASARRGRVLAPVVGVLALVLALFAMTAPAGAQARHATKPPAGKPAPAGTPQAPKKDDDQAGKPKDVKDQDKPKEQDKPRKPKDEDKPKHDNEDQDEHDDQDECDRSGHGNPCQRPQQCGENSGPGNANDQCPAGNPECPVAEHDAGMAQHKVKGEHAKSHKRHKDKQHKHKQHNDKRHKNNKHERDDAECVPPPAPQCGVEGKPACDENNQPVCGVPGKPACDNNKQPVCGVPRKPACDNNNQPVCGVPGKPACDNNQPVCGVPGKPACDNNQPVCGVPGKPACDNNNQPVSGAPAKPACDNNNQPVCTAPQVLQNGVCVTPPNDNNNVAGQPVTQQTPGAPATQPAPNANQPTTQVAGTQAAAATARLRTQTRCGTRAFRVTITGRNVRRVTLFM